MNDAFDTLLAELFDAEERGRPVSLGEFTARHGDDAASAQRVFDAFTKYREMGGSLGARPALNVQFLANGTRLGDFEIEGLLERGGMGVVYRARQLSLGNRPVALKVLPVASAGLQAVGRFQREALALAGLHHPHLAEVYGFGEQDGCIFFAMRRIDGPTLRDVLERRASARREGVEDDAAERTALVARLAEIADALALVHESGLVHRDVKPSNIMFESGDAASALSHAAVLVDFGLARPVDAKGLTLDGNSPGTPSYAPPEQLLGREVDVRADVFSLGVTLHDLLARRQPHERWQGSAGLELLTELVPEIDADLAAVVAKSTDPEARWRYADAQELRDDLRAWLDHRPVRARHAPWPERVKHWTSRHPQKLARIVIAAVAVIVVLVTVGTAGREIALISAADKDLEDGDVQALERDLEEIGSWVPLRWVGRAKLAELTLHLNNKEHADPVVRIAEALRNDEFDDALHEATTLMRSKGFDANPLIARFFLREMRLGRQEPERAESAWPTFAARLFYERPALDPSEANAAERFRVTLLEAWDDDNLPSQRVKTS